jgi:hypothetical protein
MKTVLRLSAFLLLTTMVFATLSCSPKKDESQSNKAVTNTQGPTSTSKAVTGTITANPNPIKVCDKSGSGVTTLTWTSTGTSAVEVHVGKPNGDLFAKTESSGTWTTAKWVGNGMVFYLQDVSAGKPLTRENTIATVTVAVTNEGCP